MPHLSACDTGVVPSGGGRAPNQNQTQEDLHDWLRWSEAHVPLQGLRGPPFGREDHAIYGHHQ